MIGMRSKPGLKGSDEALNLTSRDGFEGVLASGGTGLDLHKMETGAALNDQVELARTTGPMTINKGESTREEEGDGLVFGAATKHLGRRKTHGSEGRASLPRSIPLDERQADAFRETPAATPRPIRRSTCCVPT